MAVAVVKQLEMVHIDHEQRKRLMFPTRPGHFALQGFVQVTTVIESGESVPYCQFLQL